MTTTVAERLRQGAGFVDRLVSEARQALPDDTAAQIEAGLNRATRQARRGLESASDVRDEARLAIKRHPFAVTALAFAVGTVIGVTLGRVASTCARKEPAGSTASDIDAEC
jgi:hypothetical protein